jgi:uncharacterized membrane protein
MKEQKKRSLMKSLVWRLIGIFILGYITWLVTSNWEQTTIITVSFHLIRTILYYFHERVWLKIKWGIDDE